MTPGPMRLQKFLSRAGVASRRASEDLIRQGRVRVDGRVVTEMGSRVDPERSVVTVDGERVETSPLRWVALHKQPGYLCTRSDPSGRPTVYDLLPADMGELFHVGRLDYMSEGLLLLTNQGDLAHRLLHPSSGVEKRYEVGLVDPAPPGLARRLLEGVELGDGPASADAASLLPGGEGEEGPVVLVTLHEGRNREIRRMMDAVGARIRYLRRKAFGPIELGDLPPGAWRELAPDEVAALEGRAVE
ncbi:MAG TPA: pseudouridine synthase [Gemmatimonadota bacterium]|nr:pseudouridine synthase [Gemmatimonadota bacterium]